MLSARARTPLDRVIVRYVTYRKVIDRVRPDTATGLRKTLTGFAAVLGPIPIGNVSRRHVVRYIAAKTADGVCDATLRLYLSRLRTFAEWCRTEGYTRTDFMVGVKPPRKPRSVPRSLTAEEVRVVLGACTTHRELVIVTAMVQCGLRCGEVSRLRMCDLDFSAGLMTIRGKGGHVRELPIVAPLRRALLAYLAEDPIPSSAPLIRSQTTGRALSPATISALVAKLMLDAGIRAGRHDGKTAHALRHTMACDMLDNGAAIEEVVDALGHAGYANVHIYTRHRNAQARLRTAMEGREY